MTKIAYRAQRKFEAIAENAARGRFPCEDPVEQVKFDYPALAERIRRKNKWEDEEYARIAKANESRRQRMERANVPKPDV